MARRHRLRLETEAFALLGAGAASAKPILMPTLAKEVQQQRAARAINPPPPPCPQFPTTSCTPLPETPATTLPFPGNMAYYGGHVVTNPKIYLVYWGWGEPGAFPASQPCSAASTRSAGTIASAGPPLPWPNRTDTVGVSSVTSSATH